MIWLRENLGCDVVTITVDTGGFDPGELEEIETRSRELGAVRHVTVAGREEVFDRFARVLIQGNILRGRVYPLSVAAERVVQAEHVACLATEVRATGIAHGSTGAGNDQVRFDGIIRARLPETTIHAPIRELGWSREEESRYLEDHGVPVPPQVTSYSINAGLWGTTIGGRETHDPWEAIFPDS